LEGTSTIDKTTIPQGIMLNKTRACLGVLNVLAYLAPFYINIKPHLHVAHAY